jgi:cell division protein FtsL
MEIENEIKAEEKKIKKIFSTASKKCCAMWSENKTIIVTLVVVVILVAGSFSYRMYQKKNDIGPIAAKAAVQKFVDENVPAGTKTEITDPVKEIGLYKISITVSGQKMDTYLSLDGKKFFPQAIDLVQDKAKDPAAAAEKQTAKTEAENKTDVPTVDLFVMSYCPYGLQMERGILPAVEALGNKIKFNLKFVSYTLHGQKEVDENLNQYCIEKNQPTKLDAYIKCFWKNSTSASAACMKTVGINSVQVKTCVADATKQFSPTEKSFSINADDNTKYGVQGSPTLVINGTTVSSGRDSASVLKAICSGFTTAPKECSAQLSATAPGAGFDDQIAAAGKTTAGGSASGASCGQ